MPQRVLRPRSVVRGAMAPPLLTQRLPSAVLHQYRLLSSVVGICKSLESLFGPNRMLKAFVNVKNDETGKEPCGSSIVSDTLHVIDGLNIEGNPAAYVLRQALHAQYMAHGTGVTSLVLLISKLCQAAQHLLSRGFESRDISAGFYMHASKCQTLCDVSTIMSETSTVLPTHKCFATNTQQTSSRMTAGMFAREVFSHVCTTQLPLELVEQARLHAANHSECILHSCSLVVLDGLRARPELNGRIAQINSAGTPVACDLHCMNGDNRVPVLLLPVLLPAKDNVLPSMKSQSNKPRKLSVKRSNLIGLNGSTNLSWFQDKLESNTQAMLFPLVQGKLIPMSSLLRICIN